MKIARLKNNNGSETYKYGAISNISSAGYAEIVIEEDEYSSAIIRCKPDFFEIIADTDDRQRIAELEKQIKSAIFKMKVAIEDGEKAGLKLSPLRKFVDEYENEN